ncbi:MAG: sensor histidine kinase, partial [Erythrobacteraceae bacterium]|nr:sensor histidine kinase [Erythrobacteraceae bacterium]
MDMSQPPKASAAKTPLSVPFRTVLVSMLVLWGTYFVLITARSYILDMDLQTDMLVRRLLVTFAAVGLTLVLWLLVRLGDRQPLWVKIGAASLFAIPIAIGIGQINQLAFDDIQQELEQKYAEERGFRFDDEGNLLYDLPAGVAIKAPAPDGSGGYKVSESLIIAPAETREEDWRAVLEIALGRYFLLLAWASTYFALLAGVQARAAERREQQFRSAAKAAELRSLRYQV